MKNICAYSIKLKLCMIVKYTEQVINVPQFFFYVSTYSREIMDVFPDMTKNFIFGSFTDIVQVKCFKVCMLITLLGVYQLIPGLTVLLFNNRVSKAQRS